ncbi:hypothetical protein HMPREF9946_01710 [Acetobacteraceae bacterium AT-5844]|nr:hypothetical protein HMPREF9946_01710 [Acetobacteraceae bacterium AT-5844]
MQLSRFLHLLDTYGADLQRWPAIDAAAARALLATSAEAQADWNRAVLLDEALRDTRNLPDAATLERMRAHVARHVARTPPPARPGLLHWLRPLLPMGSGALAALALCAAWLTFVTPAPVEDNGFSAPRQIAMIESTE